MFPRGVNWRRAIRSHWPAIRQGQVPNVAYRRTGKLASPSRTVQSKTAPGREPGTVDGGFDVCAARQRRSPALLGLVATSTAFGLAAFGPILFLNANEPQSTSIFTDDTGSLDTLVESAQQLFKVLGISKLNTHKCSSPPSKRVSNGLSHARANPAGTQKPRRSPSDEQVYAIPGRAAQRTIAS